MTEPTERSTPRTSSTKVMPIAITATWVDCVRMLRKLASEEAVGKQAEGDAEDYKKHQRREPQRDQDKGTGVQPAQGALLNPTRLRS